jgi:hypothetical protein
MEFLVHHQVPNNKEFKPTKLTSNKIVQPAEISLRQRVRIQDTSSEEPVPNILRHNLRAKPEPLQRHFGHCREASAIHNDIKRLPKEL